MPDEPTGTPAEGAGTPSPEAAPESNPVLDRVNELAGGVDEMRSQFGQFMQAQQPAPEPEPDPWAEIMSQYGQPDPEPDPYAQQQPPPFDPSALRQAYQADLQQATAPLMAQIEQMQARQAYETLTQKIPQLKDPEVAQQLATQVQQRIARYPEATQRAVLADPDFYELVFKAAEAEKLAAGQAPASGQIPALETAGGALPGGNSAPVNPVHQAYGGRQGLAPGFG